MTLNVAILTLTLVAASGAPAPAASAAQPVSALELLPLPVAASSLSVDAHPMERSVVVESASASSTVARALRATSRLLCPEVAERDGAVRLTCRSTRVVARVVPRGSTVALELKELAGLPGDGPDAMPIVFHDPLALGLGTCPGSNDAARGECRLRGGDVDGARSAFAAAGASPVEAERDHALLRLGDLELAAGAVDAAQKHWAAVESLPWRELADARRCELSVQCLVAKNDAPSQRGGLPMSVARELTLRSARVRAFRGDAAGAAWMLQDQFSPAGACSGDALLCRRIVLAALRSSDTGAADEALAVYASAVRPGAGPHALELATAAADVAERIGAPAFAAAQLSNVTALVSESRQPGHLLRTAELYVAAGDAVRARVILDFVRSHRAMSGRSGARWSALSREVAELRARATANGMRLKVAAGAPASSALLEGITAAASATMPSGLPRPAPIAPGAATSKAPAAARAPRDRQRAARDAGSMPQPGGVPELAVAARALERARLARNGAGGQP